MGGQEANVVTDYILKVYAFFLSAITSRFRLKDVSNLSLLYVRHLLQILGLEICADTMVGDEMLRGISGGQRKRVTTGKV
jgi:ABC-type multidrug transport system ATPase subunit